MKHYKDESNNLYAYESDGSQDAFIKEGLVPISDEDLAAMMAAMMAPTTEQLLSQLTAARKEQERLGRNNQRHPLRRRPRQPPGAARGNRFYGLCWANGV